MQEKGVVTASGILIDEVLQTILLPLEMIFRLIIMPFRVIAAMFDPNTP